MGDLVLTCTGDLSRNRTVGLRIGRGEKLADITASMKAVAEGVLTSRWVSKKTCCVDERQIVAATIICSPRVVREDAKCPRLVLPECLPKTEAGAIALSARIARLC